MDTLRVVNFRSAEAFETSPIFKGDKHPDYDLVVDVGTYDGADFTIPAYKKGYTVFSFELSPQNQALTLDNFAKLGLAPGKDYTVVDVVPGTVPDVNTSKRPHIYFFKAGASNRTVGVSAAKDGVFTEVSHTPGSLPIVRIDDIIQPNERVYLFKVDAQGHEYPVTDGARQLLQNNVHSLQIEFWPTGIQKNGDDPKKLLHNIYDWGYQCFDMGFHSDYIPYNRPSDISGFVDHLLTVPPSKDPIGGWEDMICIK
ncbi:S-adenosyl-L-methionine-dependent methyltransferase [Polychytrium aggregatum]|uniref:S-adenosyl-L-methionine-dependent methyltransferase n=1 Tax=Polychytrium aggregatum TaxID=110093 RepID=UPI0022FEF02F|nr:S-adenosyl-L-methionine-dependent methyltransferase [Polychytrium aggregatum]KAI9190846.1 S-adenosyl-L-methionine-dependent methyltransferase [Polychytrium aggregatum]